MIFVRTKWKLDPVEAIKSVDQVIDTIRRDIEPGNRICSISYSVSTVTADNRLTCTAHSGGYLQMQEFLVLREMWNLYLSPLPAHKRFWYWLTVKLFGLKQYVR